MKQRIAIVGTLALLALLMISSMVVALPYTSTQRAVVNLTSGNGQYSYSIPGALYYDNGNVTLPWKLGDFNQTMTKIVWTYTGFVNLTGGFWNERVFGAGAYHNGQVITETLYMSIHQGGGNDANANDTWSYINFTMDSTAWSATVYYYLDNVADLKSLITTTETDVSDPKVAEVWTVNDTLTLGTLPFAVNISLKFSYPSTAVKTDSLYWNATGVSTGAKKSFVYQKYGPAHDPDDIDVTGTVGDVTATFDSKDKLDNAIWTITFADEQWDGMFANINANSLVVEMNGDTVDAKDMVLTTNSLEMNKLDVDVDDNELTLTWTISTITPITQPTIPINWYEQSVYGFPVWLIIGVIVIIVVVLYFASSGKKKK